MRRILILLALTATTAAAQQRVVLDLEGTVKMATDNSLPAQRAWQVFDASRYQALSWQASRKPQFALESVPVMYERYMTQRYLSTEDVDIYRQQRMLYSQAGITVSQVLEPLGGQFYGSTQLGYLRTFGDQSQTQFMTVPVLVGYRQDLLFFNPLKWDKLIEPLKLTIAEKNLVYEIESVGEEAVDRFFTLALAQEQLRMAEEYTASCDTIYAIAERRFKIASISKAELGILDLERTNARTTLANARIARGRAAQELASFLGMERTTELDLVIPPVMRNLRVDAQEAIAHARENNPLYLSSHEAVVEARRDSEKARVEKNLSVNLDVSVGLNQVADRFGDAWHRPLGRTWRP